MAKAFVGSLNSYLKLQEIDAIARFEPADDDTVDDEISFSTADGSRYPVSIQMGGSYCSVVVYEIDSDGEICAATHGVLRSFLGLDEVSFRNELCAALIANPPSPKNAASTPQRV